MKTKLIYPLFFLLLLLAGSTSPLPVHAATITVTTTDDEVNEDGDCSLREAIIAANTDSAVDACPAGSGADVILLPAGTYVLTRAGINNDDGLLGDLDISAELTITGAGRAATIIDANGLDRALHILSSVGNVEISRLTVRGGSDIVPGAVYIANAALHLSNARVRDNAGNGAVYVTGGGILTLTNSRVYGNSGGGLFVGVNSSALVRNSLISGNSDDYGAGISNSGAVTLVNSTLSGNSAANDGGGLRNDDATASATFINSTVANNTADADGDYLGSGGGIAVTQGTATAWNSIIAANSDGSATTQHPDCSGALVSEGYNLIQSTTGCTITGDTTGNITGVAPGLAPLQDNGGPTLTHALLSGSPAIDAANPAGCLDDAANLLAVDQRNFVRPVDGGSGSARCDIGAFEYASGGPRPTALVVNTTGDVSDVNPGDGRCDTILAVLGDQCSLRGAIEELNALGPGIDPGAAPMRIEFDIAGSGPHTILPAAPLPELTSPAFVDGASQPGASCPTANAPATLLIVLDGINLGTNADGLVLQPGSSGSTIQGLVLGHFDGDAINLRGDNNTVLCNHIGLAADGVSPMPNGTTGVFVGGDNNEIGGAHSHAARNVISANARPLQLFGAGNRLLNNFIGTTAGGMSALGNDSGIPVSVNGNIIGGSEPLARNIFAASGGYALYIGRTSHTVIMGNYIGVALDGVTPLSNDGDAIILADDAEYNVIGGVNSGEGNIIAHSEGNGIEFNAGTTLIPRYNQIRGNAIYDNEELGINMDEGSNDDPNLPQLTATPGSAILAAALEGQPNTTYEIDLFANPACDPSGYGEGQTFLGVWTLVTNAAGQTTLSVDLAAIASPGDIITATATDPLGNTSAFSACVQLDFEDTPTPTPTPTTTPGPSPTPTATGTPPPTDQLFLPFFSN